MKPGAALPNKSAGRPVKSAIKSSPGKLEDHARKQQCRGAGENPNE
jgi:hypothetical protein